MSGDFKNNAAYSVSRDNARRECELAFYYNVYASWNGWPVHGRPNPSASPRAIAAYAAKHTSTSQEWIGKVGHGEISEILQAAVRNPQLFSIGADGLLKQAAHRLITIFEEGLRQASEPPKGSPKGVIQLSDMGSHLRADEMAATVYVKLESLLTDEWPGGTNYLMSAIRHPGAIRSIEKLNKLEHNGLTVFVQLDLWLMGRESWIIDWKFGQHRPKDLARQLDSYDWAGKKLLDGQSSRTLGVYARETGPEVVEVVPDAARAEARIEEYTEWLESKVADGDLEANNAIEELFEPSNDPRPCARCRFYSICKDDGKLPDGVIRP